MFVVVATVFRQGYFAAMYSFAVLLHETAHYITANKLFYRTTEIRLDLFGAVLYGDFQDVNGADRIKIALAGPIANFCLCLLCLSLWWLFPDSYYYTEVFFTANLTMACVNLLPCYPLDGGRVLTGLFEKRLGLRALAVTKWCTVGFSLATFGIFVASLFTPTKLFALGLFAVGLFSGAFANGRQSYARTALINREHFFKKGMEKKTLVFDKKNTLSDVAKRMQGNFLYCLEVVDKDMRTLAVFDIAELEELVLTVPLSTRLGELIQRDGSGRSIVAFVDKAVHSKQHADGCPAQRVPLDK